MPRGHDELGDPFAGDDAKQHPEHVEVTTAAAQVRRSPLGRGRSSGRREPAAGVRCSPIISRMCSTDAEDRLPTSARERRLAASALSGSFRARCTASRTFGPPGWQIQLAMSSMVRSCSARKAVTLAARPRSTTSGSSVVEHDTEAVAEQPPAERVAAVGVDHAAGGDHRAVPRSAATPFRPVTASPVLPAAGDEGDRAVAEQPGRHHVGRW